MPTTALYLLRYTTTVQYHDAVCFNSQWFRGDVCGLGVPSEKVHQYSPTRISPNAFHEHLRTYSRENLIIPDFETLCSTSMTKDHLISAKSGKSHGLKKGLL